MVKGIKHKLTIDDLINSARDHIGRFLDNLNARDLIYVISYFSAVALIYESITGIALSIEHLSTMLHSKEGINILGMERRTGESAILTTIGKKLDGHALLIAFVGAYGLLKLDLGDVSSAVGKITTAVAAIGV